MINEQRLVDNFLALLAINSPSKNERALADFIIKQLNRLGLKIQEDNSATKIGGNTGNLLCFVPATNAGLSPLLFSAHLDTVKPTKGIKLQNQDGWLSTDGKTILGADDKAGIAVILEMLASVTERQLPHGGLEIVLTVAEETGLEGAKHLNREMLNAKVGFVLDSGDTVDSYVVQAPTEYDFYVALQGKSAHAGVEPEKGINAIHCAAKALANLPIGRVDEATTCNIGKIIGGETTNIVPELVELWGEVRSLQDTHAKRILKTVRLAFLQAANSMGAKLIFKEQLAYQGFDLADKRVLKELLAAAAQNVNLQVRPVTRGGGSDANVLNAYGICTTNLGLGIKAEHSVHEKISLADLISAANLVTSIVEVLPGLSKHLYSI